LPDRAVEHHRDVELLVRRRVGLHDERLDRLPLRPGLEGLQRVLEHQLGDALGLLFRGAELHAAELVGVTEELPRAAPAGVDLGLHHDPAAVGERVERGRHLVGRLAHDVPGYVRARGGEQLFGLVLVNLHRACSGCERGS
jgi:hypothetical protein